MSRVRESSSVRMKAPRAGERGRAKAVGDDVRTQPIAGSSPKTPSFVATLRPYIENGWDLIPLDAKSKVPLHKNWTARPYDARKVAHVCAAKGYNVGVRLRAGQLVIDVDPRNGGELGFKRLCRDIGADPLDWPRVQTGSRGSHYYLTKPDDVQTVGSLPAYPGVEFKSRGRQVVAAGSIHPDTGNEYEWCIVSPPIADAKAVPDALLDLIRRPERPEAAGGGEHTAGEVAAMLEALDPADFREHDKWLRLMMACHHASGGEAREEFLSWSASDPEFAGREDENGKRWDSLGKTGNAAVTTKTLYKLLHDADRADAIPRPSAEEDFDGGDDGAFLDRGVPDDEHYVGPLNDWVYVADAHQFVRRDGLKKYKPEQWRALYAGVKKKGDVLDAIWRGRLPMRKFESLVYKPDVPEFPDGEAGGVYNIWRPSGVEAREGDTSWFEQHLEYLFPDARDRGHFLDYLALNIQRPGEKVLFAPLVFSPVEGIGKSAIGELMALIIGERNVVRPSNDEVNGQYSIWQEGAQLAIIEELMAFGRLELANRLKTVITEPSLRISEKHKSSYTIPNHLNLLCFTNHGDALRIGNGDRRWLVLACMAARREDSYYKRLFARIRSEAGAAAVKHLLLRREVRLNPKGTAPVTAAKEEMRVLGMGDAEAFLREAFDEGRAPFDFDLVRLEDLVDALPHGCTARRSNVRALVAKFLAGEIKAVRLPRYTKSDRKRPGYQLWAVRNPDKWVGAGVSKCIDAYEASTSRRLAGDAE